MVIGSLDGLFHHVAIMRVCTVHVRTDCVLTFPGSTTSHCSWQSREQPVLGTATVGKAFTIPAVQSNENE